MLIAKLTRCLLIAFAVFAVSLPSQAAMVGTAQMQSSQLSIDLGSIAAKRDWIEEQLVVGGKLVVPVGDWFQHLTVIERTASGFDERRVISVAFVPMTGEAQK